MKFSADTAILERRRAFDSRLHGNVAICLIALFIGALSTPGQCVNPAPGPLAAAAARVPENDAVVPITAVKVTDITVTGATKITPVKGNQQITHFVTPKGGATDKVTLTAVLSDNSAKTLAQVTWDGATQDPNNPLVATVPKNVTAENIVTLKLGGVASKVVKVWVIWASVAVTIVIPQGKIMAKALCSIRLP